MKQHANIGYHTKINELAFKVRLKRAYKKASTRELQLTIQLAGQELERRSKK